jgi:hypothetical protein
MIIRNLECAGRNKIRTAGVLSSQPPGLDVVSKPPLRPDLYVRLEAQSSKY